MQIKETGTVIYNRTRFRTYQIEGTYNEFLKLYSVFTHDRFRARNLDVVDRCEKGRYYACFRTNDSRFVKELGAFIDKINTPGTL